ncbi:hypothetical protein CYK25_005620 [Varibaculum cambriense]|nr:hypothetical protein CYK25_005620 [Varibaculum cambriense]
MSNDLFGNLGFGGGKDGGFPGFPGGFGAGKGGETVAAALGELAAMESYLYRK